MRINWSRVLYITAIISMLTGVYIKISGRRGWEVLYVVSAAALAGNFILEQFNRNRKVD